MPKTAEAMTAATFLANIIKATKDLIQEKKVPIEAIYRLATPSGQKTLAKIVDLAHADWKAEHEKPSPPPPRTAPTTERDDLGDDWWKYGC